MARDGRLMLEGAVPEGDPAGVVVGRDGAGEVVVVVVPVEAAAALASGDEHVLPEPELLFAVGYDLGDPAGFGRSVASVRDDLQSVCPLVLELADEAGLDLTSAFVRADVPVREPLGDRFARWLAREHPGPVAELAGYEAALRLAGGDALAGSLGREGAVGPWKLARGGAGARG